MPTARTSELNQTNRRGEVASLSKLHSSATAVLKDVINLVNCGSNQDDEKEMLLRVLHLTL
jgi:hypothetical protein